MCVARAASGAECWDIRVESVWPHWAPSPPEVHEAPRRLSARVSETVLPPSWCNGNQPTAGAAHDRGVAMSDNPVALVFVVPDALKAVAREAGIPQNRLALTPARCTL